MSADASIDPGFSTPAMSACFSPDAHVRTMLEVEAALAVSAADLGLEDRAIADEIASTCASVQLDARRVVATGWEVGTPVLALRAAVGPHLSPAARRSLDGGHGSTSQDIVDTAMQLQIRAALSAIEGDLRTMARRLAEIARLHRDTPMIGRTFLQHARPTTFGLCVAGWLAPVADLAAETGARIDACSVQLGGPVGTLDGLGANGHGVAARLAERLSLHHPAAPWHTDRRRVTEPCALAGRIARCMATIATDVALLSSSDIGEIAVRAGGSSSMSGKRNPFDSVRAIAAADACAGLVGTLGGARPIELQRGLGGWHLEWFAVPLIFMTAGATVEAMLGCVHSLRANPAAMLEHLSESGPTDDTIARAGELVDRILHHHGLLHER
ncbi:MAG: lyase family protein [Ilumatobacteraceae bacterium]